MEYKEYYEDFFEELSNLNSDIDVYDEYIKSYFNLNVDIEDAVKDYIEKQDDIQVVGEMVDN